MDDVKMCSGCGIPLDEKTSCEKDMDKCVCCCSCDPGCAGMCHDKRAEMHQEA